MSEKKKRSGLYKKTRACRGASSIRNIIHSRWPPRRRRDGRGRRHLRRSEHLKIAVSGSIRIYRAQEKEKKKKTPIRCDDMHLPRQENGNRVAAEAFAVSCSSPIEIHLSNRVKDILRGNDTGNSRNRFR